ncbi:MAG: hypothetical protein HeimC3_47440 [Candidatus Heimdallarchaeota archaeon LC_3]|nr:MAG: hypothetical protein HeimC3_47440 [Candidatus Heimdallarchaeota archaeon LC_3]
MDKIKINNYKQLVSKTNIRNYYRWKVFIDEDYNSLNKILSVKYTLHESFPDPIRYVTDPKSKFSIISKGWGEFKLMIDIKFKNSEDQHIDYILKLDDSKAWPQTDPDWKSSTYDKGRMNSLMIFKQKTPNQYFDEGNLPLSIISLGIEIENIVREIFISSKKAYNSNEIINFEKEIKLLKDEDLINEIDFNTLIKFWDIRNSLVHSVDIKYTEFQVIQTYSELQPIIKKLQATNYFPR